MDFSRFYEVVVARYSGNEVDAANVDVSRLIFFSLSHFYRGLNDVDLRREIFPLPLIYIYKLSIESSGIFCIEGSSAANSKR